MLAEELNRYAWQMLASHYNCSIGQLTPPQARAYRDLDNGSLAFTIWQGTGGRYGKAATKDMVKAGAVSLESLCFPPVCPVEIMPEFEKRERYLAHTYYRKNNIRSAGEDTTIIRELDSPDLTAYSYQNPYFSMGCFAFCDTWNQRRNCMVVWDKEHPKYFRLRCINGDYDFCSGVVSACQEHNRILGQLGLVSDRGSFHYILDREKNGIYDTDALYFVFELGGDTGELRIRQHGKDFILEDGQMRIILHIEAWLFDGKSAPVELSEDGKKVLLLGYRGEKKRLDTTLLEDTYGVFTMTAVYGEDENREGNETSVIMKRQGNAKLESSWDTMKTASYTCTVPYRKALGLDGMDREKILSKIKLILSQMQHMQNNGTVEESCPISIISMDAWEWPQGVALFAMYQYYRETKDADILTYLTEWYEKHLAEGLPQQNINTTCPMLALACLYEETGNEAYRPVLEQWCQGVMESLPRTEEGGLQHVVSGVRNEGQLWDDTLYMTVLFLAKMGEIFERKEYLEESIRQFLVHLKYLTDLKSGLFYHGWTFCGKHHFAEALWGRGNSWYTAGLVDYLECLRDNQGVKEVLLSALYRQVQALERLQDESGLWHTLLDDPTSYLETSASCAFAYGILKAVRKGYLPSRFEVVGEKALKGVIDQIEKDGTVRGVSYGTPVFPTLEEYRQVPVCPMPYGQSMALMMLVEALKHS